MATQKMRDFIAAYVGRANFNGTEAARLAKYKGSDVTLASVAYENLRKPQIRDEITRLLNERAMPREEVLHRIGEQARGNLGDFLVISEYGASINLEQAKELGKLGLVKKYRVDKDGNVTLELYSAQTALDMLAKAHGIYSDAKTGDEGDFSEWLESLPKERG